MAILLLFISCANGFTHIIFKNANPSFPEFLWLHFCVCGGGLTFSEDISQTTTFEFLFSLLSAFASPLLKKAIKWIRIKE